MSSDWGKNVRISIFGESHGPAIGVVMDGLPPGMPLDMDAVAAMMARRAPGRDRFSTQRAEPDTPEIQSGLFECKLTGTPLCAVIRNTGARSADYSATRTVARPGHADLTGNIRYLGANDPRGGGHFSGRLTAPLTFAGAVASQLLASHGVTVAARILSIRGERDEPVDYNAVTPELLTSLANKPFPTVNDGAAARMQAEIDAARMDSDSVGGIVECFALGLPPGLGSPMFDGVENAVASLLFGVPAVRGIEFGAGFAAAELRGSDHNDAMRIRDGSPAFESNRHGGALGGVTTGAPLVVRAAFKPTPSIARPQQTIDFGGPHDAELEIHGRHDPCIVPRAVVVVEACVALAILDIGMEGGNPHGFRFAAH